MPDRPGRNHRAERRFRHSGGSDGPRVRPCHLQNGSQLAISRALAITQLIREARRRAGLSQAELARRAGVAQSTVGRIESGLRVPSTDLAERLVRAAGFEIRLALGEPDRTPTRSLSARCDAPPRSGWPTPPMLHASCCARAAPWNEQVGDWRRIRPGENARGVA